MVIAYRGGMKTYKDQNMLKFLDELRGLSHRVASHSDEACTVQKKIDEMTHKVHHAISINTHLKNKRKQLDARIERMRELIKQQ